MKTFKSFLNEAGPNAKPKAKGEADFVAAHKVEITDIEDQEKEGSAKVVTKDGSGKRKADRLDNKQAMGEEVEEIDEAEKKLFPGTPEYKAKFGTDKEKHELKYGKSDVKKITPYGYRDKDDKKVKEAKTYRKMMKEADFTKKQTTMAHTIGKEFEKKGVGDPDKGGPYAVASAMVRDKPEAAKKAYATIKSKMKEEADAELLFKLYDDLNEENQEFFMQQLEEDAEALLLFAQNLMED